MDIKKVLYIVIILAIIFVNACKKESNKTQQDSISSETTVPSITYMVESKNDIFTNKFFENVCMIRTPPYLGQYEITKYEEILEVCQMFASLEIIAQREQSTDDFELPLGMAHLTFCYTDGTEYTIGFGTELYYGDNNIYTTKEGQFKKIHNRLREICLK
ncbi:MAG: hypothetical protein K2N61_05315 [Lachnospiraceae bacterium]|nr:hypothetical protein [Lachnospiraceae bacterium]